MSGFSIPKRILLSDGYLHDGNALLGLVRWEGYEIEAYDGLTSA